MKYEAYKKRFDKFLTKYKDLCSEYEEIMNDNISEYEYDIYQLYEKSLKINKQSVLYTLLQNALYDSINSEINILDSINNIINKDTIDSSDRNITQTYFNEVQQIYNKYNHDYDIEYSEENRDKLIEMNLKSVISIAKRYQGLGLSLNELISAGNLGLCVAFEKFDPSRAKLKELLIEAVQQLNDELQYSTIYELLKEHLSYGNLKEKWESTFHPGNNYNKQIVIDWIGKNVVNAKFNSVANMWIRAFILIEIDNNSRVVKKPKIEINKDRDISGTYQREKIIDIDSPISLDNNMTLNDVFFIEDETKSEMEINELYISFKQKLNILLDGVKSRDRSILLKKFGIGLPRPLLPKEIAEQEGLSSARVTQIFQNTLKKMMENAKKFEVDEEVLYDIINNIV